MVQANIDIRAKALIIEMFGVAEEKIIPEASLTSDLDLDSIDTIDLLSTLNDEFLIDASPFDFEGCETIGAFLERLKELEETEREKKGKLLNE